MIEELGHHGYKLSPGTLYPILQRLEEDNYLEAYSENVGCKMRKYYMITPTGLDALDRIKEKMQELVKEVLV